VSYHHSPVCCIIRRASKGTPGDAKCVTEILWGTKIRKFGAKFKFGQLILRKIGLIKNVATRCHILRLKRTKFNFGWGSAADPAGGAGAHSAPPDPLAGFKRAYF